MSTALKQFLQEQGRKYQAEAEAAKVIVDEWRLALERLFGQIRSWLKDSDPEGMIAIEQSEQDVSELGLGRYRVPRLNLRVFGKWIGIIPKARRNVGSAKPPWKSTPERAEGRVDITNEVRRYVLFRFRKGDQDVWVIDGLEPAYEAPSFEEKEFNRETFEKALLNYLK